MGEILQFPRPIQPGDRVRITNPMRQRNGCIAAVAYTMPELEYVAVTHGRDTVHYHVLEVDLVDRTELI